MANVQNPSHSGQSHNKITDKRTQVKEREHDSTARDNLSGDYAGHENRGPAAHQKDSFQHDTDLRQRDFAVKRDTTRERKG